MRSPPAAPLAATAKRSRGPLATALAAASSWLLEPAQPAGDRGVAAPALPRPVIAVFGLTRGCGATMVARALAAELAGRDPCGAAAVHCDARTAGIPLATPAAGRLARLLADVAGADTRAVGRLCLVGGADCAALADTARHAAPLVLDAGASALGGVPAALADEVLVVAGPSTEPALPLSPPITWGGSATNRSSCSTAQPARAPDGMPLLPTCCPTHEWAPSWRSAGASRAASSGVRSLSSPTAARGSSNELKEARKVAQTRFFSRKMGGFLGGSGPRRPRLLVQWSPGRGSRGCSRVHKLPRQATREGRTYAPFRATCDW